MNDGIKLSHITIGLHWLVGLGFISVLCLGFFITYTDSWNLLPLHKSFGVLVFFVASLRIIWRVIEGWPQPISGEPSVLWHTILSKLVHWLLIIATVTMPITGITASIASGRGLAVFGAQWVASVPNPAMPDAFIPYYAELSHFAMEIHEIVPWVVIFLLFLHVAGALKAHFIDKSGVLVRMLGKRL